MCLINCLRICSFVNRLYLERALLTEIWMCGALRTRWRSVHYRDAVEIWSGRLLCVARRKACRWRHARPLRYCQLSWYVYDFNQIWKFAMCIKVNMKCFSWAPLPYQPWRSRLSLMRGWESGSSPLAVSGSQRDGGLEASLHVLEMTQN